jgi:SAM-dependent methyltransferase
MSDSQKIKKRTCPLCNKSNNNNYLYYESNPWKLVQCECSFVYMPEVPVFERMKNEFSWERNFNKNETVSIKKRVRRFVKGLLRRDKLKYLLNTFCKSGDILDIGCGSGAKFDNISDIFTPFGIDISEESAREANESFKKRGGEAVCAPSTEVLDKFGKNKFSGAILRAYLEHEHEPFEVLKNLKYTLKNDAYVIIKVPNYASVNRIVRGNKWCGFRFPDHVNQFTPKTLLRMVRDANYKVVKFNFFDYLPTSDNMWMVIKPK